MLILRYLTVSATTALSWATREAKNSAQMKTIRAIVLMMATPVQAVSQASLSALSGLAAPRFWPTRTEAAMFRAKAGRYIMASILRPLAIAARATMLSPFTFPRML